MRTARIQMRTARVEMRTARVEMKQLREVGRSCSKGNVEAVTTITQ